jgi:hypothetical protein
MSKRKAAPESSSKKKKKNKEDEDLTIFQATKGFNQRRISTTIIASPQRKQAPNATTIIPCPQRKQAQPLKSTTPHSAVTNGHQNIIIATTFITPVVPKIEEPILPYKPLSKTKKNALKHNTIKIIVTAVVVILAFYGGRFLTKTGPKLTIKASSKPLVIVPPSIPKNLMSEIFIAPVKVIADSANSFESYKTSAIAFTNWVLTEHKKQFPNGTTSNLFSEYSKYPKDFDYKKVQSTLRQKFRHEIVFFEKCKVHCMNSYLWFVKTIKSFVESSQKQFLAFYSSSKTFKRYFDTFLMEYISFEDRLLNNLLPSIMPLLQYCAVKGSTLSGRSIKVSDLLFYCVMFHRFILIVCILAATIYFLQETIFAPKGLIVSRRNSEDEIDFALPILLSPASHKRKKEDGNESMVVSSFSAFNGHQAFTGDDKVNVPLVTDLNNDMLQLVHPDSTLSELDDTSSQQNKQIELDSISRYISNTTKPDKKKATITSPLGSPEQSMSSNTDATESNPKRPATPSKLSEIKGAIKNAIQNLTPGTPTTRQSLSIPQSNFTPTDAFTPKGRHSFSLFSQSSSFPTNKRKSPTK